MLGAELIMLLCNSFESLNSTSHFLVFIPVTPAIA